VAKMAKNGTFIFAWAWKNTSRIKQKLQQKGNFEMVSNLSKLQKKWFF
jgi:hypothetical protein